MQLNVTKKAYDVHIGNSPIFDPDQDERKQILRWQEWSAKWRLFQAFTADQSARDEGNDPDEGR